MDIGSNPNLDAETSETMSLGPEYTYDDNWVGSINYVILELRVRLNMYQLKTC